MIIIMKPHATRTPGIEFGDADALAPVPHMSRALKLKNYRKNMKKLRILKKE